MNRLSEEQRAALVKCATDRLRTRLAKAGVDEDDLFAMDRTVMLEAMAQIILDKEEAEKQGATRQQDAGNTSGDETISDLENREFQKKKLLLKEEELQFKMRKEERRNAERKADEKRWEAEVKLRQMEFERQQRVDAARDNAESSLVGRTRKFAEAIKHVFPDMPTESAELPAFFDSVENLFTLYEIPYDLRSKLLIPRLSGKAKAIVNKFSIKDLEDYEKIKKQLLAEFRLTPRELRSRFTQAKKGSDETFALFTSRLESLLTYYLRSRHADKDVKKMFDLFIADKLKDCLPPGALQYVLSLEGDESFSPSKIASNADTYTSNYDERGAYRGNAVSNIRIIAENGEARSRAGISNPNLRPNKPAVSSGANSSVPAPSQKAEKTKKCYGCDSEFHFVAQCPNKVKPAGSPPVKASAKACSILPSGGHQSKIVTEAEIGARATAACSLDDCSAMEAGYESSGEPVVCGPSDPECVVDNNSTNDVSIVHANGLTVNDIQLTPLKYMDVFVNSRRLSALIDSGCECPLVDSKILVGDSLSTLGTIWIQPIVGAAVPAKLAALDVTQFVSDTTSTGKPNSHEGKPLHLVFAVVDNLVGHDVVLPASVAEELKLTSQHCEAQPCVNAVSLLMAQPEVLVEGEQDNDVTGDCDVSKPIAVTVANNCIEPATETELVEPILTDTEIDIPITKDTLAAEQAIDESLRECRTLARAKKGGYYWQDDLLFHNDHISGQPVKQLVLPSDRRSSVLKLAHDKCGYHQGQKRTSERIRLSFYWPGLRADVVKFCNQCEPCLQRSRLRVTDRVPIREIERPDLPGAHLMMDVIGPIDPPSSQGHKYLLCIIDVCTSWPSVYLLKNLSAKSVCESLCDLFSTLGVASVISCDNATNFSSRLTQEFLQRIGCSPRFSSPGHPECQGKIERFNQSFKRLLHHAIRQQPRQWHKCIPFLTWAMRECSNATTNASPYVLLYGRLPRGPLAVLKETWSGERDLPPSLNKSEVQYMEELKNNLEMAREYASDHAAIAQEKYVSHYNKNAIDKAFSVDDRVIVLHPDSTNKLRSKWQIGTVSEVLSQHSYLVDMPDGARRHLHANKLRPCTAKAQSVILDRDKEFGNISALPKASSNSLPSERIDPTALSHLSSNQQVDLLNILDAFPTCFEEKPGFCSLIEHEIITLPGFVPKRAKPYKIPEMLKVEVDRQIEVLLKDGFIRPSTSPMTSPIVCVLKKQKRDLQSNGESVEVKPEVRITVDFRYLNSFTQKFPFPVPDQEQVMAAIGNFKIISVFDMRSSYHQIAIKEEHRWLSAFVTHSSEYEWCRTAFGMSNSGSTFIRAVYEVLKPIKNFTVSYVDDMAVGSQNWCEHKNHLIQFLSVIKTSGMTLNLSKSEFAKSEVPFVGHIVGSGQKRIDPDRLIAIEQLCRPHSQKQLRSLLGMLNYHRSFIKGYAELAKPLTDLTSKKIPSVIPWTDREQVAFDTLKEKLCQATALHTPRIGTLFIIRTDASGVAVAGCLNQLIDDRFVVDEKGTGEKPIAFCSQKLTPTQCAWSVIEREAYAVIFALKKFHHIIFGAPIIVYSDHNPLSYVKECSPKSAKLMRWALALQEYDLSFRYVKAVHNVSPDCLSRLI